MIINGASIIGQTLGVYSVRKLGYNTKIQLNLVPLIATLACLPYVVRYADGEFTWVFSNCLMVVIGKRCLDLCSNRLYTRIAQFHILWHCRNHWAAVHRGHHVRSLIRVYVH